MASAVATPLEPGEWTYKKGFLFSCILHVILFIALPVAMVLSRQAARFERPSTFQLVAAPPSLNAFTPQQRKLAKRQVKRTVKKQSTRPVPSKDRVQEENLDELASLLEELPTPASVAPVGSFKYNWYLANVSQKISRYWNPPVENRNISVIVAFTIFRDGSISNPKIKERSGDGTLDNLALRAVQLAAPFGKMPPGFSGNKLELTVTLIPTTH
ncbi:MAG: TonB family protein [Chitinispirillaceae bacterium]|nr:TonB family protein [Chitinispirillaceae bacterium]